MLIAKQSLKSGGSGLGVNVDVSNQTFWVGQKFEQLARNFLGCMDRKWENSEYIAQSVVFIELTLPKSTMTTCGKSSCQSKLP